MDRHRFALEPHRKEGSDPTIRWIVAGVIEGSGSIFRIGDSNDGCLARSLALNQVDMRLPHHADGEVIRKSMG
jgi:hypothetical protein